MGDLQPSSRRLLIGFLEGSTRGGGGRGFALTFRSPLVARPAPTRQRSTNERPALHRKQTSTTTNNMKASSACVIAALLASSFALQASALGEGVEWFGAGQQSLGQLQALKGFYGGSPKEFGEGLWNQAVGQGVSDQVKGSFLNGWGNWLRSWSG